MLALTHRPDSLPQFKHPHEFPRALPPSSSRAHDPPSRRSSTPQQMATPHRGLPPPAAMTLPDPTRVQHQSLPPNIGPMPGPPPQWHGSEDSMRDWLSAKSEEDKRRQEEEKTRQEELRLEQRRVEQNMLRESVQSGVPPHMVPVIFAGIGGPPLANASMDMAQQYLAQMQQQQQHQTQMIHQSRPSPELRQEQRLATQPHLYQSPSIPPPHGSQAAPGQVLHSQPLHASVYPSPAYQSPGGRSKSLYNAPPQYGPPNAMPSGPRGQSQSSLPRLTTNEPSTSAPSSYTQQQDLPSPSPSIYFHHWQPPTNTSSSKDSAKTSPKNQQQSDSPPRKRKNQSAHQPQPAPSTSPSYPESSNKSSRSHGRPRGDSGRTTSSYDPIGRTQGGGHRSANSGSEVSHQEEPTSRHGSPPRNREELARQDQA